MPSTVIASSLLNEPSCILGLKANEIDAPTPNCSLKNFWTCHE